MNETDYRCKKCNTIVPPRSHHKMETCECGSIMVDEGLYGSRLLWPNGHPDDWIERIPKRSVEAKTE